MAPKAVVAMSGGVDSSVSAAILKDQGYDVTGIMLKLWGEGEENNNSGCCNVGAAEDARRVADVLGIPFYVFNFAERFAQTVIADFKQTYGAGRTPNPCVRCNQWIKFDMLLDRAKQLGAEVLATGHYAQVGHRDGVFRLRRGVDPAKDQSYVMWMLTQDELAHVRFPVGDIHKSETREIASSLGLRTAHKPDSQEICFVRAGELDSYISNEVPEAAIPGRITDVSGTELGEHRGVGNYTIGQRKGLGISLGIPAFVTNIDAGSNTVVIGSRADLAVGSFRFDEASFVDGAPQAGAEVLVQHRAHGETNRARVHPAEAGTFEIVYDEPVEAIAPGQSAVLYSMDDSEVLGGGIISATAAEGAVA